jgi:predicted NAD-dependent protein-ADP-ribosyltransferase YbiA (DUF1768 family)
MDIGSQNGWPASALSNFAPHPFIIDGVECASMEGFLQSLKFKNPEMQKEVCKLVGKAAKFKGKKKKWWREQTLFWQGHPIKRDSEEFQLLLTKAFDALFENDGFRNALKATNNSTLTHSIGKNDIHRTVLTEREFIHQLNRLRDKLN